MAEEDLHVAQSLDQAESECSDAHSSSYTASLVQSAAKSVLDHSTSMVSDDESSHEGATPSLKKSTAEGTATLESLQKETIPALPSLEDRKRFIGCLAAVLASSHEYDYSENDEEEDSEHLKGVAAPLEVFVRKEEAGLPSHSSMSSFDESCRTPIPRNDCHDSGIFEGDEINSCLQNELDQSENQHDPSTNQNPDAVTDGSTKIPVEAASTSVGDTQTSNEDVNTTIDGTNTSTADTDTSMRSERNQSLQRKASSMSLSQSVLFQNRREAQELRLSLQRHRKRRHQVASDILLKASKYLDLDVSQSKAFLPVLARLLKPPPLSEKDKKTKRGMLGLDKDSFVWPFLDSMSQGSGFRCLSMLLLQHLLRGSEGYDARVRRIYKKLSVLVLVYDDEYGDRDDCQDMTEIEFATRKFEALEHGIASKILELSGGGNRKTRSLTKGSSERGITRDQVMRGLKIGSAGIVAGTLFAVTGGLAAPGIAAGVAALAGSSAAAAGAVVFLSSTAAVTTIFGVGGAGLAAYKMHRRQQGLTEFEFQKESGKEEGAVEAELFTTICISGWLRDECDFQRPWGVEPSDPPIRDKLELLERFYWIHKRDNISKCEEILSRWKGHDSQLWSVIKQKYGRDPSHLFPLENGPRARSGLTVDQKEVIHDLFVELGYVNPEKPQTDETPLEKMRAGWRNRFSKNKTNEGQQRGVDEGVAIPNFEASNINESFILPKDVSSDKKEEHETLLPYHLKTVWDYQQTYGGELYTVRYERDLLQELCNSVEDLAVEAVSNATQHILKTTVFATLLTAVAIPTALVKVANMIDGSWTLAIERSDEAGKELAKSLLFSQAGRRPVTLVGYSLGARVIYCCLKELARYQEQWEQHREMKEADPSQADVSKKAAASKTPMGIENMREPASILEDVIMMGMPNHLSVKSWYLARQLVAGRLINCYSRKDLVLTLMFRYKKITGGFKRVCGTSPIEVPGVENYDVSDLVTSHAQYSIEAGTILKRVRHGQPIRGPQNSVVVVTETKDDRKLQKS